MEDAEEWGLNKKNGQQTEWIKIKKWIEEQDNIMGCLVDF